MDLRDIENSNSDFWMVEAGGQKWLGLDRAGTID